LSNRRYSWSAIPMVTQLEGRLGLINL
jgi:hypothetical protein